MRIKHLVQGMEFSTLELPNEYVFSKIYFFCCDASVKLLKYILSFTSSVFVFETTLPLIIELMNTK